MPPMLILKIYYMKLSVASYLSLGPLLFLYIYSVKDSPFSFKRKHIYHFVPAILYLIIPENFLDYYFWRFGGFYVIQGFFLVYLIVSVFQIYDIRKINRDTRPEYRISSWLRNLIIGIFIIWTSVFFKRYNYFPELVAFLAKIIGKVIRNI